MLDAYLSGQVRRYHANPQMAPFGQTTADHQWGCAILLDLLHPNPSKNLIMAALKHDAGELLAGDVPYPFKLAHPEAYKIHAEVEQKLAESIGMKCPELTKEEAEWLRFVDRLECFLYVRTYAPEVFERQNWSTHNLDLVDAAIHLGCAEQLTTFDI